MMQLIATKRPAAEKYDRLNFVRDDGSSAAIDMPRQGIPPHDLLHYLLETGLGLCGGFLSLVAAGQDARYVMELVHAPDRRDILRDAVHAEALVEAMQTQLWSGCYDHQAFLYGLQTASEFRGIESPLAPSQDRCMALFEAAIAMNRQWSALPAYQTLVLEFPSANAK